MTSIPFLKPLLYPGSVALVGVSDDASKTAARPLSYLKRAGYRGTIYPVNPSRDTIQGEKAYPSLADLPERPDHVFVMTNAESSLLVLRDCVRLGVPVATILAVGFSEAGDEGRERERRLKDIIRGSSTRILGPSSIGLANLHEGLLLTANAAFAEPDLGAGDIFVASQSGSLIGAILLRGKLRGLTFSSLVSVGGESDLTLGGICEATLDDPKVGSYILFLESMRHAEDLRRFAEGAAARGKPVAAYKLGRSKEASELAVSHTGALAGEDDVADEFLRDCGIARVETFDGLLEVMPLLRRVPLHSIRARPPRIGIVTTTGGGAAMAVDQLALRGAAVTAPGDETFVRMEQAGVDVARGRIVDLTMAGTRYEVMKASLDVMATAPEFDMVLAVAGSSARFQPELAVKPVADSSAAHAKPLASFIVPDAPEVIRRLITAGVPAFRDPETCADAIVAAYRRAVPDVKRTNRWRGGSGTGTVETLDEAEAYAILGKVGIAHASTMTLKADQPVGSLPFPYPVVAKVLDRDIPHKSDLGGVVVGISNSDELKAAIAKICASVERHRSGAKVERILVQAMEQGIGELLVGYRVDPQMGSTIMLAAGGVATELYRDRSLRMAPISEEQAWQMIDEVKACRLLAGYRGRQRGDLKALATLLVNASRLSEAPEIILEAEVNPVIVKRDGEGVVAVDALVRLCGAPV